MPGQSTDGPVSVAGAGRIYAARDGFRHAAGSVSGFPLIRYAMMPNLKTCCQTRVPEAGCDEAGRGCLAGPLVAAAVILPPDFSHPLLNDSKRMKPRDRDYMRGIIMREAVAWAVEEVSPQEIDRINILRASIEAMSRAAARLVPRPGLILVDGNRFYTPLDIPWKCVVGGDGIYADIAAASVLAKTRRDEIMVGLDAEYPLYGWRDNKGYATRLHRIAIREHGLTPYHRLTFNSAAADPALF